MQIEVSPMEEVCCNCQNYYQHYVRMYYVDQMRYACINQGHCCYPRVKDRRPLTPACQHFAARNQGI